MRRFDRVERHLPELMTELASASVPDYFDDMLRQTSDVRQRPAWSALERWLPMGEIARPLPMRPIPWRPIAILAMIGLLLAATAVYVGSSRRVPAPFGSAANGQLFYHGADGVIYASDPVAGTSRAIVSGPEAYASPLPSRSGRQIVYEHSQAGTTQLHVAAADGSDAHPLRGTVTDLREIDWSPDDRQIAIISMVAGVPTLSILEADGSGARTLSLGVEVESFWYLPDGRLLLMASAKPGGDCHHTTPTNDCSLDVVGADGSGLREILDVASFQGIGIANPAPDGRNLLYVRWADGEAGRLHVVDIATGKDHPVRIENEAADESINQAEFSPDGSHILFDRYEASGEHWAVVPTAGGSAVNIGNQWPAHPDGTGPEAHFSPDGRSVVAFYPMNQGPGELWLLDATGQTAGRRIEIPATYAPPWQRVAP